jgi:alcohol dehydrogenase (cytochrome c)
VSRRVHRTAQNHRVERSIYRPFSGVTWHPSSYNVEKNLMYICAGDGPGRGKGGDPNAMIGPEPNAETRRYVQGTFGSARDIGTEIRSTLVAMNVTNHKVTWRRLLDNRCADSITTAGGLIFAGRFNGKLTAMNSDTGQRLWSFQTDGRFTTTATTFEHEGVQYLAGIAGGGVTGGRLNESRADGRGRASRGPCKHHYRKNPSAPSRVQRRLPTRGGAFPQ